MLIALKYLLNISSESAIDVDLQRLYFHFDNNTSVVINYKKRASFEEKIWEVSETDLPEIINSDIQQVSFVSTEYLGYREDISKFKKPDSQSLQLFAIIKKILSQDTKIISSYCIIDDYRYDTCDGYGCPDEPNYGFIIFLNKSFWDNTEIFDLLKKTEIKIQNPPLFYWKSYKKYQNSFTDSGKINILTTNTKTRRLGYFSILAKYFIQFNKSSENIFNKKFESYSAAYSDQLSSYKNSKGEIKITMTGNSAGHYTNLAKELELINPLNRVYSIGKSFKVYLVLKKYYEESKNIFELTLLDKIFFLETLLRKDYLYITWLFELIYIQEKTNYRSLNNSFHFFLIERTSELLNANRTKFDSKLRRELTKIKERITKWEKAETYLEHVIMPRINWLFDLELIELDDRLNIELTEKGKRLFYNICYLTDIKTDRFINFETALNDFYIQFFNDVYFNDDKKQQDVDVVNKKIKEYIIESFHYFKTLAPNRVTASQAILFTKYKLYLSDKIKVEYTYIKELLETNTLPNFIFKFQKKYGDGYIQLK